MPQPKSPINIATQCRCRICVILRLKCIAPTYIVLNVLVRTHGMPCDLYIYVIWSPLILLVTYVCLPVRQSGRVLSLLFAFVSFASQRSQLIEFGVTGKIPSTGKKRRNNTQFAGKMTMTHSIIRTFVNAVDNILSIRRSEKHQLIVCFALECELRMLHTRTSTQNSVTGIERTREKNN